MIEVEAKMNTQNRVPYNLVREAENLSKETKLLFRDCLDIVCKTYRFSSKPTERTE